ncbi:hypothetical protein, partial [Vibrio harveyi]|uniref:hypothetical protein n=1 Tax=Vibrio harveyi TaxID=669 RepID=UPI000A47803A
MLNTLQFSILKYAVNNVPYYKGTRRIDLKYFPILKKESYREIGEKEFLSKCKPFHPFYKMNTGGSTGQPYEFLVSIECGVIDTIHQEYQHKKMGYIDGDKIHVMNGCEIPESERCKNIFWQFKSKKELPFGSK